MRLDDWHSVIAAKSRLPAGAALQLDEAGFVVIPGPAIDGGTAQLSAAHDRAVATADPADVSIRSTTRVSDFVNKGAEFDALYIYPPLLAACCRIIGRPFKLSSLHSRTLEPGAPEGVLHVDVKHQADGWPLVGFIVMVDAFTIDNGATRFVPGSHRRLHGPETASHEDHVLACGPAGSVLIFNGSAWHGFSANRSSGRRRSIQGAFIPRDATSANNWTSRLRPETSQRIGDLAKYILDIPCGP